MNVSPKVRTERINLRCTPEDKKVLLNIAKDMGIPLTQLLIFGALYFAQMYYRDVRKV